MADDEFGEEHIEHLERRLHALKELCSEAGSTEDVEELLLLIHRPGWTTLREGMFVNSLMDATEHALGQVRQLRKALLECATAIAEGAEEAG
jgi:hypothetical protein